MPARPRRTWPRWWLGSLIAAIGFALRAAALGLGSLVLVTIAATVWQQSSFQAGTLTASLPTLTVAEPAVGSVLGILVLGERLQTDDVSTFALVLAVIVMATSTAALARGAAVPTEKPRAAPATQTARAQSSGP